MSIATSYGRATRSSHLQCTDEPGDVHILIAAGKVRDGLGMSLLRLRAERDSISKLPGARVVQTRLLSWRGTRDMLMQMAVGLAERRELPIADMEFKAVVESALDLWLDPKCPACNGVGTIGGYGAQQTICLACNGGRLRRLEFGRRDDFAALAADIAVVIDDKTSRALQRLARGRAQIAYALQTA